MTAVFGRGRTRQERVGDRLSSRAVEIQNEIVDLERRRADLQCQVGELAEVLAEQREQFDVSTRQVLKAVSDGLGPQYAEAVKQLTGRLSFESFFSAQWNDSDETNRSEQFERFFHAPDIKYDRSRDWILSDS
ncbi:MAG: hypothetical protein GY929_13990 [Actinomycetia bacterium]|nr:hypothetical protein [Actinomycetes bacterium]